MYISLYYLAFYVVMTSLFSLSIWALMTSLDPYAPDYQDRLQSPGNATSETMTMSLAQPQWIFNQPSLFLSFQGWWCGPTPTEKKISKLPTTHRTRPAGWGCPTSFTSSWSVRIWLVWSRWTQRGQSATLLNLNLCSSLLSSSLQWHQAAWL